MPAYNQKFHMKIILANKFYYNRGGDCNYVINLEQLLKSHGHEVAVFAMDYPQNFESKWKHYFPSNMTMPMALTRPFGSIEVKQKFTKLLNDFNPDVVHLNNIHTQISPIIAELAHKKGVKVIWTIHDYKLLCARYDCLKEGKQICEECFGNNKRPCIHNKCIKSSWLASYIGYKEASTWNRDRLNACTDIFICPSSFMAKKMEQGGFPKEKIVTLCNFMNVEKCKRDNYDKADYCCFIGRLSHEKGIVTLIKAINDLPFKLKIIGSGALEKHLKSISNGNVEFLGFKQWNEIKQIVGNAKFSIIPSEWYENNPLSVIESKCLGTPVLGSNIGGIPELTSYTFECGNEFDLKMKIKEMWQLELDYKTFALLAQEKYDSKKYYNNIINIYKN